MKRESTEDAIVESGKRKRQEEQKEAFHQDRAEIYALLDAQNDSVSRQNHKREEHSHDNIECSSEKASGIETEDVSRFEDSSDEDEKLDKKWLAAPTDGSVRRQPRIGYSFQAVLPSISGK